MAGWAVSIRLGVGLAIAGGLVSGLAADVRADETDGGRGSASSVTKSVANISRVRDRGQPATTVKEWIGQMEAAQVQVTNVNLERSETGLDIVLETAEGKPLTIDATQFRIEGNNLIADIPNATLALPQGQPFVADNPTADIATVQVEQQAGNVRVSVAGNNALPKTEVTLRTGGLAYSLNPEGDEADEEIVVTGEGQQGYRVPNASVGTRTDTPLRDIPQSIQVTPRQVLEDQQVDTLREALRNVPGVVQGDTSQRVPLDFILIRGFFSTNGNTLRNGIPDFTSRVLSFDRAIIDQIEILKGPASVLYGQGSPGGTISYLTKQPLSEPFYKVEGSAGSFDFYRGSLDLSGPLDADKTVLYRLNLAAQTSGSFVDFFNAQRYVVAPTLTWLISDKTKLTFEAEYLEQKTQTFDVGLPAVGTVLPNPNGRIPRNRYLGEPDFDKYDLRVFRVGYSLEHRFSEDWQLRNAFRYSDYRQDRDFVAVTTLQNDNRTMNRVTAVQDFTDRFYSLDTYVVGKFATGSIQHQLVTGFALNRLDDSSLNFGDPAASIDVFNPVYGLAPNAVAVTRNFAGTNRKDSLGIYIQDQISVLDNLKLLIGGRFDIAGLTNRNLRTSTTQFQQDEAFTPRVGIVYQPIPPISLYASYAQSFNPQLGTTFEGEQFKPERGTQYEVGIKADINNNLSATLALYDLTLSNVLTADARPNVPPNSFSIQTGEQRSRGVELTVAGEILPGWNVIAGYAYTNATVTNDTDSSLIGNSLSLVPKNSFNLWTTYQIQEGSLQGFGFGFGLFYVGERQGDLQNTFQLPSYLRTDAVLFYKKDRFRAALNFRNLLNVDYFEAALNRNRVFLGDPFTVQGTISWEF